MGGTIGGVAGFRKGIAAAAAPDILP